MLDILLAHADEVLVSVLVWCSGSRVYFSLFANQPDPLPFADCSETGSPFPICVHATDAALVLCEYYIEMPFSSNRFLMNLNLCRPSCIITMK